MPGCGSGVATAAFELGGVDRAGGRSHHDQSTERASTIASRDSSTARSRSSSRPAFHARKDSACTSRAGCWEASEVLERGLDQRPADLMFLAVDVARADPESDVGSFCVVVQLLEELEAGLVQGCRRSCSPTMSSAPASARSPEARRCGGASDAASSTLPHPAPSKGSRITQNSSSATRPARVPGRGLRPSPTRARLARCRAPA